MVEKEIVFALAEKLEKRLEGEGRYRVVMTRDEDVFIPLATGSGSPSAKADLFISIHADTISGGAGGEGTHDLYGLGAGLRREFGPARRPRKQGRPVPPASIRASMADDGFPIFSRN